MNWIQYSQVAVVGFVIAMSGTGLVYAATEPQDQEIMNPDFDRIDVNKDGYISAPEAKQYGLLEEAFKQADGNHDKKLSRDEFIKASSIEDRLKVGKYIDDSWITTKVKTELLKDSLVKGVRVSVETYKGAVHLSGYVNTPQQAAQAELIASSVNGVQQVFNNLIVKN